MKVIFSGLVDSMIGSFAGATIRRYKQGFSCYPKVNEKRTKNPAQSIAMNAFFLATSLWNELSEDKLLVWDSYRVSLGFFDISTYNFFM